MSKKINYENYDVVVIGGGCAGIAAAVAAAKNGARTLILESGPMIGSDLLAGLPIDGCLSSRGEWIVKGVAQELFDMCDKMGGYIGAFSDRRALWMVAVDPEVMNIAIIDLLHKYNVDLRLYTFAEDVVMEDGEIKGVIGVGKSGGQCLARRCLLTAPGTAI